jgi:outer membrane protein
MEKILKTLLFSFVFLAIVGSSAVAQKFGHLNSGNLLIQLPETKKADEELRAYQENLVKKGEEMAKSLQDDFAKVNEEYSKGHMSPLQAQQKQAELEKRRDDLGKYEQEVVDKVGKKREELFAPVLDKVQVAINAVGKENGYQIIFDSSIPNVILFALDTDNVESLVKAKLGL